MPTIRLAAPLLCLIAATPAFGGDGWTKPRPLRAGDVVRFVAPASAGDMDGIVRARKTFEAKGLKVVVPEGIDRKRGYLAGTDDERVAELNEALRDPDARAVVAIRGGYGLTRILDRIDYEALREHPKLLIGFSDLTGLHLAASAKCRMVTIHGPMPLAHLNDESDKYQFTNDLFWKFIRTGRYDDDPAVGLTVPAPPDADAPKALVPGTATGRLTGGNLTLVSVTVGTPFQIETEGRIVFLEDTQEPAYRVDRMLSQLRLAGLLDAPAGVILGSFDRTDDEDALAGVFREYFAGRPYPVVTGFPVGHDRYNVVLPCGVPARLDADAGALTLLEPPLATD